MWVWVKAWVGSTCHCDWLYQVQKNQLLPCTSVLDKVMRAFQCHVQQCLIKWHRLITCYSCKKLLHVLIYIWHATVPQESLTCIQHTDTHRHTYTHPTAVTGHLLLSSRISKTPVLSLYLEAGQRKETLSHPPISFLKSLRKSLGSRKAFRGSCLPILSVWQVQPYDK